MSTLSDCIVKKLTVSEIWEKGILEAPLPPQTIDELYNKMTLQNLYDEKLLTREMDLDLLALAVSNTVPDLLWLYINQRYQSKLYSKDNSFSEEGEAYIRTELKVEDIETVRKNAIQDLLDDLMLFFENLDVPHDYPDAVFVSSKLENGRWKLLVVVSTSNLNCIEENPPTQIYIFYNLDDLIASICRQACLFIESDVRLTLTQREITPPGKIDPVLIKSFDAISSNLGFDTKGLWEKLKRGEIVLKEDFQLSLLIFKEKYRVTVMGENFYLVTMDEDGVYFIYFTKEDGLAFLTSFFLPGNRWVYTDILKD